MIFESRLETPRLIIRPFIPADASTLVALFADPQVARFVDDGTALSADNAALWVLRSAENLARHGYGTGAVERKEDGLMIGWAGVARPADGSQEIIYGLARAFWRRGYGGEILSALVEFAAGRGIDPVRATVDPRNLVSVRLLTGHGFALAARGYNGDADSDLYQLGS
ncbi:GNAT family N-acetyltransferase [Sphingomonas sp.]|uniref:GNAT family N-acetyltransferase n=1 Tax=Sphingomonas sp. TaxID=28214 RepID=UPI003D6CF113